MKGIKTQGIKYMGSKKKIIPYIVNTIKDLHIENVCDAMSGTTRVAQAFAQMGYNTTSNDIADYSKVFGECYLLANKPDAYYQDIINYLNSLEGVYGWFSENYGGELYDEKKPFQLKNTMKLDAIREEIDKINLEPIDKSVILTSLILAMDTVDSTLGHQSSYLREWSPRSYDDMKLILPMRFNITTNNAVLQEDVFKVIKEPFDLIYLDPPYGSANTKMPSSRVRYNAYYHIWKSIVLNDKPQLFGKANRREDSRDKKSASVFENFKKEMLEDGTETVKSTLFINDLIEQANAHYILLSFNNHGSTTKKEICDILSNNGDILNILEIDYKRNVMANMCTTNEFICTNDDNKEYLFLLEK